MLKTTPKLTSAKIQILESNGEIIIDQMYNAVIHYYKDPLTALLITPTPEQKRAAGKIVAELMVKYGLITRMP